jgi:hypothetical protein
MAIRQGFYFPDFEDMGDYSARTLFSSGFEDPQAFMNYEYLAAPAMPIAPAMDTTVRGEDLRAQNAARLAAEQEAFMQAQAQAQPAAQPTPVEQPVAAPAPAAPVQDKASIINNLISQIQARSNTSQWSGGYGADEATKDMARILAETGITDISQFGPITQQVEKVVGYEDTGMPIYATVTEQTYGNKVTGQAVPNTYTERQKGEFFGGTYEGKGNTGYGVQFDAQGNPTFYTQGASSKDSIVKAAVPIGLMALGAYGAESLFGAGATGAGSAGATGLTAAELAQLDLALGGAGGSAGAAELASALATGAPTITNTALTGGSGVFTGAAAGITPESVAATLAEDAGVSAIVAPPPVVEPIASIQPSPVSSGTGITATNSGFGIDAGSSGLNTIAVEGGLTNTGILTGSPLGTELLGTGTGIAGLTGTGILAGSELGTALLGTTATTPLVGTGVLSGSTLGAELLGTGANTAATVGGLTGLTNAANVGYGAVDTGISTGLTGLGSGAVDTGINPSGATTGVVDPTAGVTSTTPPVDSTNPLSSLTPAQLSSLINGALGLFGALGATQLGGGGGGRPSMNVGALPTQGVPLNSQDYFNAIQQNYNTLMPAIPRDVSTPLANWYNSQYTGA